MHARLRIVASLFVAGLLAASCGTDAPSLPADSVADTGGVDADATGADAVEPDADADVAAPDVAAPDVPGADAADAGDDPADAATDAEVGGDAAVDTETGDDASIDAADTGGEDATDADTTGAEIVEDAADVDTGDAEVVEDAADAGSADVVEDAADAGSADVVEDAADAGGADVVEDAGDADPGDADVVDDAADAGPLPCALRPGREPAVRVDGRQLLYGEAPVHWKGAAWAPTPLGGAPGVGSNGFAENAARDAALMRDAGMNVVRTYGPILDRAVLDTLWEHGIGVQMTVFYGYADTPESAIENVCAVKDHPAVVAWIIGNEWNLNLLGREIGIDQAFADVAEVASAVRGVDDTRPVVTVWGGWPGNDVLDRLPEIDLWGLNYYPGTSFGDFFDGWSAQTDRPMYFAEYGADAYDGTAERVDEATQATIVETLTSEIHANASVNGSGPCVGGTVFEFNDEWWKYTGGPWDVHDTEPSWFNGGYPDAEIQEEWWGIVDIDRNPREAYRRLAALPAPTVDTVSISRVTICVDASSAPVPNEDYPVLVANGSWNDWEAWGLELSVRADGRYCGTLEGLPPGPYEYVIAATGPADEWSGWGQTANAPPGGACDWYPDDEWANWGFEAVAGLATRVCHRWAGCGCD